MRWRFKDVATDELFTMVRNPRTMESVLRQHRSEAERSPQGVVRVNRGPAPAFAWSFTGRCHAEAEQATLRDWAARDRLIIRDHLGREHLVIPQSFAATPVPGQSNGIGNPWLYEYTFKSIYLRRVS